MEVTMKLMQRNRRRLIWILAAAILTGIISVAQPGVQAEAKVQLSKTKATVCVGETQQLKLNGVKKVKWVSSKKSIASVDKNGLVTGKKKGNCVIKASGGGKNYSCKITVKKLPNNCATVNGKKVKVGKEVRITYTIAADKPVANVSARYFYYGDQLQIVTPSDDKGRFKVWAYINGYENEPLVGDEFKSQYKNMVKGEEPLNCFHQCWGLDPKNPEATQPYAVPCKNGKQFDTFYVRALKSGNFTFKATFDTDTSGIQIKNRVTETIK